MANKILSVTDHIKKYVTKANERAEKEDFLSALGFCFSALSLGKTTEALFVTASVYADMGLYELSNQYWFYYLEKTPEKNRGVAYEEIAINYFYLGNFVLSGYYFNKKLEVDGFLSPDGIDKEITDYFSESKEEGGYRLVYPLSKAEIDKKITDAKRKMAGGDFDGAIKLYNEIPKTFSSYDKVADDNSLAHFLSGDIEKGIEINRERLKDGGDKFSIYCNLSSMYGALKNKEKSSYYYSLALSEPIKNPEDEYRLATACLEHKDEEKGLALLEKVLKERAFDLDTEYLLALVKINTGRYDEAERTLKNLYRINPTEFLYKYYLKLARRLIAGDEKAKEILPVEYELDVPKKVRNEWIKCIKTTAFGGVKGKIDKDLFEILEWGLRDFGGNDTVAKACVLALSTGRKDYDNYLKEKLMDADISADLKVMILYIFVVCGCIQKYSLVVSGVFVTAKPAKINVGDDFISISINAAYAICFAKSVIMGINDLGKIAKSAEKVEKQARKVGAFISEGELATLIMDGCKYPYFNDLREICSIFGTDEIRISELKKQMKGETK